MASYNKVILVGNLTKDPELRYTPSGTAVANLRMAINRRYKDRNQETKDEVCYVTVVVWSKQAETCNQYLHKGSSVMIEGRLQSRSWEDQQTKKQRSVLEVLAERVQFLGGAPGGRSTPAPAGDEPMHDGSQDTAWIEENEEKINET
jgi:single-strand DNA-binding protein